MGAALEPSSPVPLYHQLETVLAQRIEGGSYGGGLPGELELAAEFDVSRGTVRQALERLTRRGLITRQRGRGSFVSPLPLEYPLGRFYRFAHEMSERGISESSRVLGCATVDVPVRIAHRLGLPTGARALRLVRLRLAGDLPFLLETSYVTDPLAPPLLRSDLSQGSIYDVLEQAGIRLAGMTEEVRATTLDGSEAAHFGLEAGAPALALERIAWVRGEPAEHRLVLAPGDRVTLTAGWGRHGRDEGPSGS
jgi:GntR family transcriptional regulator